MKLDARQRWLVLSGVLTATLVAAAWVHDGASEDADVVAAVVKPMPDFIADGPTNDVRARQLAQRNTSAQDSPVQNAPQVRLDKLDARELGNASKDPFALPRKKVKKRVAPKPAPVVVARRAPPPPPSAPPLPFKYMGKMVSGDEVSVFLIHGNRNLVVHEGDTIDSKYRVEQIADSTMTLTYLPLEQRQILNFGVRR